MITLAKVLKKERRRPAVKKDAAVPENTFNTYMHMVEKKAFELYEKRGCAHGRDMDDWLEAQKLVEDEWHKKK